MVQQVLVGLVFLGSLGYLVTLAVRHLRAKEGCASGCGKCATELPHLTPKP